MINFTKGIKVKPITYKLIVAGSRDFNDYRVLTWEVEQALIKYAPSQVIEIVSGGAKGADILGEKYAKERGYYLKIFPANWEEYGKSAGYKRNKQMAMYADGLVAFWINKSKGTGHMIDLAKKFNLDLHVIEISQ